MKKTNAKPKLAGGVNKDIRVKAKMLPAPDEDDDVYDVTPSDKKKTKKKSSELVEADKPKISRLKGKGLKTIFGEKAEKIQQLLEINDTDSAVSLIYKRTLQSLVDLIPYAEYAVRKSKGARGVYQINSLISSMREIMVDIQSAQDRGMMGEHLISSVIKPTFGDIAQDIVKEYSMIGADAKSGMTDKEWERFRPLLMESRARLADNITKHFRDLKDGTIDFLQR